MKITFLQTADSERYAPLLQISGQAVSAYCRRHGFIYETYTGIARGSHPWQATYNRIPLLNRMLDGGYDGWVCYLDADAYVFDQAFDLAAYLGAKPGTAMVAAPVASEMPWWRVNAGVFLISLAHPVGASVVRRLAEMFAALSDNDLKAATMWDMVRDDQNMLQHALRETEDAEAATVIERGKPNLLNYGDGAFIRQVLRAAGNLAERAEKLRQGVAGVMSAVVEHRATHTAEADVLREEVCRSLYRTLLLRDPDPQGLAQAVSGLQRGRAVEDMVRSMLRSKEFQEKASKFTETYTD